MKTPVPQLRVISVDHERTVQAAARLRHALDTARMAGIPVRSVFCHLEAGRCGVRAGLVAVEVDGSIVWGGRELDERTAGALAEALADYRRRRG